MVKIDEWGLQATKRAYWSMEATLWTQLGQN
jgi:hypothetical protein